jgi:tetratricopeptide (TPR) repeat protein
VIYSWDSFYKQYARLAKEMHLPITDADYVAEMPLRAWLGGWLPKTVNHEDALAAEAPKIQNAFVYRLIEGHKVPPWLRLVYYPMAADPAMRGQYVAIYEVVPNQTAKEEYLRIAQVELSLSDLNGALINVNNALQADPTYYPALICGARVLNQGGNTQAFTSIMQTIKQRLNQADSLSLEDRQELCVDLVLNHDMEDAKQQITLSMKAATLRGLRRLTTDQLFNLASFLQQVGLLNTRPGLAGFIETLLPDYQRVQLLIDRAQAEQKAGHLPEALGLLRRAHDRLPTSLVALVDLAGFLATAHDDSLRNGREAVVLALQAHEIDHGQHAEVLDVLGCAYAEAGQYSLAVTVEQLALNAAEAAHTDQLAAAYRARLANFRSQQPYHQ